MLQQPQKDRHQNLNSSNYISDKKVNEEQNPVVFQPRDGGYNRKVTISTLNKMQI